MSVAASAARSRPYLRVDVLDHFLAPLVLEVDVDVGRLVALPRDEALEQHAHARGIDFGDAERVADGGVRGRAAALAQDAARARERDDVVDGEEVGLVASSAISASSCSIIVRTSGGRRRAAVPPRQPSSVSLRRCDAGVSPAARSPPDTRSAIRRARNVQRSASASVASSISRGYSVASRARERRCRSPFGCSA